MREYNITYWAEYEDEVTDFEAEIFAESLEKALETFKSLYINYKRITCIKEM